MENLDILAELDNEISQVRDPSIPTTHSNIVMTEAPRSNEKAAKKAKKAWVVTNSSTSEIFTPSNLSAFCEEHLINYTKLVAKKTFGVWSVTRKS